jgi:hypothetical protein
MQGEDYRHHFCCSGSVIGGELKNILRRLVISSPFLQLEIVSGYSRELPGRPLVMLPKGQFNLYFHHCFHP